MPGGCSLAWLGMLKVLQHDKSTISQELVLVWGWFFVFGQVSIEAAHLLLNIRCVWSDMVGYAQSTSKLLISNIAEMGLGMRYIFCMWVGICRSSKTIHKCHIGVFKHGWACPKYFKMINH